MKQLWKWKSEINKINESLAAGVVHRTYREESTSKMDNYRILIEIAQNKIQKLGNDFNINISELQN